MELTALPPNAAILAPQAAAATMLATNSQPE
jgi:hypothetical protein